jgi:hypothetical protein
MEMALEVLNDLAAWNDGEVGGHMDEPYAAEAARRTITAIKEALAQPAPVQEPAEKFCDANCTWSDHHPDCKFAQPAPAQEPVAWMDVDEKGAMSGLRYWSEPDNRHEVALYTTPFAAQHHRRKHVKK